ncbi:MAG TPA: hypothetical protein VGX25_05365 [Actinophytocola sp.]|uniref:hypothetical protein n=1 Tax=Actinophytocola sp. TaxID=1872138 RepID=UPI002DDCE7AA|nr:hypothetical protein [Actinophytocola sp.]HEV2778811.1 hypothetical protein [Actinophytocola sp.]
MTILAGAPALAADIAALETRIAALEAGPGDPPTWFVRNTAAQSINNATFTALVFNTDDNDPDNLHSTSANTDRITIATAGLYMVMGGGATAGNVTGTRLARITKNGSVVAASGGGAPPPAATENGWALTQWTPVQCSAGDILRVEYFQSSGGALNTATTDYTQPRFAGLWIKP